MNDEVAAMGDFIVTPLGNGDFVVVVEPENDVIWLSPRAIRYRCEEAQFMHAHPGREVRCIGHRIVRGENWYRWQAYVNPAWAL